MVRVKTPQNTFKPSQVAKPSTKRARPTKPARKRASRPDPDIIYLLDSDSSSDEDEPPVVEMYVHEPGSGPRPILDSDEDEEDELVEDFKDDLEEDELEPTPARAKSEDEDYYPAGEPYPSSRSEYKPSPSPDAYEPPSRKSGTKRKPARSKPKRQHRQSPNGRGSREQRNSANRANLEPAVLEPQCLPPVETTVDNHWIYLFFRFCAERHEMYGRREAGCPREQLSQDETMMSIHIGNVFRQLDPSSSKIRANIIEVGDQSPEEVCCESAWHLPCQRRVAHDTRVGVLTAVRVFLYCMFYKDPTWEALCAAAGGIPTWKNYESDMPAMEAALHDLSVVKGQKLYYGGFQIVPPNVYFTDDRNKSKSIIHYASSLRLVLAMMRAGLPAMLLKVCPHSHNVWRRGGGLTAVQIRRGRALRAAHGPDDRRVSRTQHHVFPERHDQLQVPVSRLRDVRPGIKALSPAHVRETGDQLRGDGAGGPQVALRQPVAILGAAGYRPPARVEEWFAPRYVCA